MKKLLTTLATVFFTFIYSFSFAQWHKITLPTINLGSTGSSLNKTITISSNSNIFYGRCQMGSSYFKYGVVGTNDDFNTNYNVHTSQNTNAGNLVIHALNDTTCQISFQNDYTLYTATQHTSSYTGNTAFNPFYSIKQLTYGINYTTANAPAYTANIYYINTNLNTQTLKDTIGNTIGFGNLYFTNDSTGYFLNQYIHGNYFLKKTTNYAATWVSVLTCADTLQQLHFPTNNVGYVVGNSGLVYKTINAGTTWNKYNIPANYNLYTVHFINPDTGYVAGASGALYKTLNGGLTWNAETSTDTNAIYTVQMVNDSTVYFWDEINLYKNNYTIGTTAIKENLNKIYCNIYPNPAQNNFTIETSTNEKQTISVFDINGNLILSQTITGTTNIDAGNFNAGVYNISITSSTGRLNKRLIIIK